MSIGIHIRPTVSIVAQYYTKINANTVVQSTIDDYLIIQTETECWYIMRDIQRIGSLLDKLRSYWIQYAPDLRFGQVFEYLSSQTDVDSFYLEDEQWYELIEKLAQMTKY